MLPAAVCVIVFSLVPPAWAHKVIAAVYTSGDVIEGEIGFSNGDMAADTLVEVLDGDGNKIGETKTDADGFFVFQPTQAVTHVFRANLGAGHIAEVRLALDEMSNIAGVELPRETGDGSGIGAQAAAPASMATGSAPLTDAQRELIADVVRQEVKSLRREIAEYKDKHDLQTILGGIGYILGLFGVGFYFAARNRLNKG